MAFLGTADAQTGRSLSQIERARRAESARAERLRHEAEAVGRELQGLDARLLEASRRRGEAEAAALAAEERLNDLRWQAEVDARWRAKAHAALEDALIAAAFTRRRIEPHAVRMNIVARAAAPAFAAAERGSLRALASMRDAEGAIAAEKLALAQAQAVIESERTEMETLLAQRRAAQAQLASDAAAAEQRATALAAEARSLRELAQRVARQRGGAGGAATVPAAWLAPAEGRIVRGFGAREGAGPASQGVVLGTRAGAQVISPAAGEVAYADAFRSYGQVLILNLDGGYALVLTGLDRIAVQVGETVLAGQPLGEMSASVTAAPELYVEVRRNGQPVDPGRWLGARGFEAEQGAQAG